MSQRLHLLTGMLGNPLNTHNYRVQFTASNLSTCEIFITQATFPTEQVQTVTRWILGEQIRYPSIPNGGSGTVQFTIPEGERAVMWKYLRTEFAFMFDQVSGVMPVWAATDFFKTTITSHGLRSDPTGRDPQSLSAPVLAVELDNCFISDLGSVSLNAQNVTSPWDWQITVTYSGLRYLDPTPLKAPEGHTTDRGAGSVESPS